jgi:hypothetical protein
MSTAAATAFDATNVAWSSEALNRTKGFLGTSEEMTAVAEIIAPHSVEWVRSLSDAELLPLGERALHDIADDILVLDEIRQRFHKSANILGYNGWKDFVTKNSRYSIRTIQRHLAEKNGKDESKTNITTGNMYTRSKVETTHEKRIPIPIGTSVKGYHIWEEFDTDDVVASDHSHVWLLENLKTGKAELWKSCTVRRLLKGLKTHRGNDGEAYEHGWDYDKRESGMNYWASRTAWAQLRLAELKGGEKAPDPFTFADGFVWEGRDEWRRKNRITSTEALELSNPDVAKRIKSGTLKVRSTQTRRTTPAQFQSKDFYHAVGHGLANAFAGVDARLVEIAHMRKSDWNPAAEEGVKRLVKNLEEVSKEATAYATKFKALLRKRTK